MWKSLKIPMASKMMYCRWSVCYQNHPQAVSKGSRSLDVERPNAVGLCPPGPWLPPLPNGYSQWCAGKLSPGWPREQLVVVFIHFHRVNT